MSLNQQFSNSLTLVDGEESGGGDWLDLLGLPEECLSSIISLTSPRDACIIECVSKSFLSAARSDAVWNKFLPIDCLSLVPPSLSWSSKKELYFAISDGHVLIENGRKSFWLDKHSGKKCYMLSARSLGIVWGDTPEYWEWISLPESRFSETAKLLYVWWLEIRGKMNTQLLSPETMYTAFLVFKGPDDDYSDGFDNCHVEVGIEINGIEIHKKNVWLSLKDEDEYGYQYSIRWSLDGMVKWRSGPSIAIDDPGVYIEGQCPRERRDGWMEIELGDFFNNGIADEDVEMSVMEVKGGVSKSRLIVQGIELRPKNLN